MRGVKKALLYFHTIRYLKFVQIVYQLRNRLSGRGKERLLRRIQTLDAPQTVPVNMLIAALDLDETYLSRFPVKNLLENEVEILHEKHQVDLTKWEVTEASHLWNYNLHYLEFLIPLAVFCNQDGAERYFQKWCEYVDSWIEHPTKDSFAPYTISMRIPNLLICMNLLQKRLRESALERKLIQSIYRQYQYLRATQELSQLANHYFENLKTLVICSLLFGEKTHYEKYFAGLCRQIKEQILPDGLHYERSIMYHKILLEDILRVYMAFIKRKDRGKAEQLLPTIRNMTVALSCVSQGFEKTPLFNDAGDNVAKETGCLLRAVQELTGFCVADDCEKDALEDAGYYKLYAGENALLFDCGSMGPSYMAGHAHCDCLSFELAVAGKTVFINSGTYQYQGKYRNFFRSTMAHNTIMIDEREQAELWGEHRMGRRSSRIEHESGERFVTGRFRSFQGERFERRIELTEESVAVTDRVWTRDGKRHDARQFFHIAEGYHFVMEDKRQVSVWDGDERLALIWIPPGSEGKIHTEGDICLLAQDFGKLKRKEVLEIRTAFVNRIEIAVAINLKKDRNFKNDNYG